MKPLDCYRNLARRGVWTFSRSSGDVALYMPRSKDCVLLQVSRLEAERLDRLPDEIWRNQFPERKLETGGPEQINAMALLPTARCNFHCSYCYAAAAHGTNELHESQIIGASKYFFARWGGADKELLVSILGGGEPLCASDVSCSAMRIIRELEKNSGAIVQLVLVTNGSLVENKVVEALVHWNVTPRVSFDVLPDVQYSQRGEYDAVIQGLNRLVGAGLRPEIRTVITTKSVGRLCEIVERVLHDYPQVRVLRADPVSDTNVDSSWILAQEFPSRFSEARRLARSNGLMLDCVPWRLPFWGSKPSFCPGEFCVSPDGTLGICHWKSGHRECSEAGWDFGKVDLDGTVHVNENRLGDLTCGEPVPDSCRQCALGEVCRGWCRAVRALDNFAGVRAARCRLLRRCFDLVMEEWLEWKRREKRTI